MEGRGIGSPYHRRKSAYPRLITVISRVCIVLNVVSGEMFFLTLTLAWVSLSAKEEHGIKDWITRVGKGILTRGFFR
jgi:hypothetical protein